ncbi:DNA polymerase III subunit alpha [Solemya pervernicosa gill symbiont]|uniref:DNA polymerase III subunit alpha n=2 Tax=Gammaproteobacteria incertae sedis TaxID=118884 RepID=A0A1T2L7V6_9GAMM|nr:DNA polymerase III subunit alpha [Candidatus Reidiella endopervernicosa]OOZ41195.1 DNA polymerase III subunit alpha [Solemya pervernicosa gill symbiont]QKQ27080.1 DNA polymerase III subunit alpha [Candidatus Reidiella endopervernicosa]
MTPPFVHLRTHTEYSLVDGIVRIKPLVKSVAAAGMAAVAVTDQSNLFAMVKFYRAALGAGIKPIVGADVWIEGDEESGAPSRLVLLCKDSEGYLNLSELISRSYTEGQVRGIPILKRAWFEGTTAGLIALSGGREGDVGQALIAGNQTQANELLMAWQRLFPDSYYLELQRTGRADEERYLHAAVELAMQHRLPVVATNDVHFLKQNDFGAHEARVCIHDGRTLDDKRRPKRHSEQQYLRSPEEMAELFSDIPEAIANSVEIARRCNLELNLGTPVLPDFPIPPGMTEAEFFREESRQGLEQRLERIFDKASADFAELRKPYDERLEIELDVINSMGFPGYFLIVADFIRWAKENDVPVGPGRGSGAGSLVAYALTITDLDPLEYDLLFERFLNPERVSMPDFDVDFCMEGRDRVIDYVAEHYGREKVSQIITYGSMAAKAVVRDVGRVLGHPYGFVDRIAKMIPFEIGMTLEKALEEEEFKRAYQDEDEVRALVDLARALEGCARNAGKHAGGVVIAPSKLTDFSPLYCEEGGGNLVSQFDKDDVEAVGLVKFDFLGLRTLTIIDWALKTINRKRVANGEEPVDISAIPLEDEKSFKLLKACQTTAVFQLESRGMKDLIKRLQPDCFEDIIALVALFRPGPLQSGMVDNFIDRKHGREPVSYPDAKYQHESLKQILDPTYGVILYQEQVMQIAQVLAGYSLGGADMLRRAMGKKKPEEMAKQRTVFAEGAEQNGVDSVLAMKIFDLVEKFAGYGFNKSHSAAYALVSYQTIWLKTYYPAAFMAAVLSADMDNTDKVVTLIEECRSMELEVTPPNVNFSEHAFSVTDENVIVYGLGAIKGVGEAAIEGIVAERLDNGLYQDLFDLCRRIDLRKANKRVMESLIRAGAFDCFEGVNRASLMAQLPDALKAADQHANNESAGMADLFGGTNEDSAAPVTLVTLPEWDDEQRLQGEKETLGLYLTGHPIERYEAEIEHFTSGRIEKFVGDEMTPPAGGQGGGGRQREKIVMLAGLVVGIRMMNTRRGKMSFITLDDRTARIEVQLFDDDYQKYRNILNKDRVLVVEGGLSYDDYSGGFRMKARELFDIEQARERHAKHLMIHLDSARMGEGVVDSIAAALRPFTEGRCKVCIDYLRSDARGPLTLGDAWSVHPSDNLLHRLREVAGTESVTVEYG